MDILSAIISIGILIYSSVIHEIAHGYVAYRLGDPTAKLMGRLTLNPLKHIDWYMSIFLPVTLFILTQGRFIFGGAKPVPVDPFNLRDGRKDLAIVSLVGPLSNFALAIIAAIAIHIFYPGAGFSTVLYRSDVGGFILGSIVQWNLVLGIFNLVPIPPLDGSKVFSLILPHKTAETYMSMGNIGLFVLMALLFFPIGGFSLMDAVYSVVSFAISLLGF
jgi:Zn-dependent protease